MDTQLSSTTPQQVIIIGGGPAGLAAAIYSARANQQPLVFAGSPPGGQLTLTSEVENYPGFPSILGPELIEKMQTQALHFGANLRNENVLEVNLEKSPYIIKTISSTHSTRTLLIATGAKALWLGLDSETRLRGKGVSACATCDGFFFRSKVVAVVGGGDTAMEEALFLTRFATKVYLLHRRDTFRASKIMQDRIKAHPKIEVMTNTIIEEVVGQSKVEGLRIKQTDLKSAKTKISEIEVDGLFVAIGHKPDTDIFAGKLGFDQKGYILTNQRRLVAYAAGAVRQESDLQKPALTPENLGFEYMTDVAGVFAAGDCVDHVYRQAATAVGMGVAAALEIERYLEKHAL